MPRPPRPSAARMAVMIADRLRAALSTAAAQTTALATNAAKKQSTPPSSPAPQVIPGAVARKILSQKKPTSRASGGPDVHTLLLLLLVVVAGTAFLREGGTHHRHNAVVARKTLKRPTAPALGRLDGRADALGPSDDPEEDSAENGDDSEEEDSAEDSGISSDDAADDSENARRQSNREVAEATVVHYRIPIPCKNADEACNRLAKCNMHKWNPDESCKKAAKRCAEMPYEKQRIIEWCKSCLMGGRSIGFCYNEAVSCGRAADHCMKSLQGVRASECGGKATDPFPRELIANQTVDVSPQCIASLKMEYDWEKKVRKARMSAPSEAPPSPSKLLAARQAAERREASKRANDKGVGFVYPELQY